MILESITKITPFKKKSLDVVRDADLKLLAVYNSVEFSATALMIKQDAFYRHLRLRKRRIWRSERDFRKLFEKVEIGASAIVSVVNDSVFIFQSNSKLKQIRKVQIPEEDRVFRVRKGMRKAFRNRYNVELIYRNSSDDETIRRATLVRKTRNGYLCKTPVGYRTFLFKNIQEVQKLDSLYSFGVCYILEFWVDNNSRLRKIVWKTENGTLKKVEHF